MKADWETVGRDWGSFCNKYVLGGRVHFVEIDLFEKHGAGTMIRKATIDEHEAAIAKVREIAAKATNEVQVLHAANQIFHHNHECK